MRCLIPVLLLSVWCAGCASTKYKTWQGGGVRTGPGGACETVEGVEVWSYGSANRPHQITGLIEDERPAGALPMAMRMKTVARKAKAAGADGVIVIGEGKEYMGSVNTMNAFSTLNASTTGTANTQFYPQGAQSTYSGNTTGTMNTFGTGISAPMFRRMGLIRLSSMSAENVQVSMDYGFHMALITLISAGGRGFWRGRWQARLRRRGS